MGHFLQLESAKSSGISFPRSSDISTSSLLYDFSGNRKYLTMKERKAFLRGADHLPKDGRTFCIVLAYTGCRISEALALTPRRVDFQSSLVIFESLKKRRRGIYRAVPVPRKVLKILDQVHHIRAAQSSPAAIDDPLWQFGRTTAWSRVKLALALGDVTGVQASPKGLRHAFGVSALQAGVPINLVKKWLGHSRMTTTAIYADAVGDEEQLLAARFWKTFKGS